MVNRAAALRLPERGRRLVPARERCPLIARGGARFDVVDRHEVGIGLSGGRQRFALPSLPRERRSISRPAWATGAPPETPVFRSHLDNLIFSGLFWKPPLTAVSETIAATMPATNTVPRPVKSASKPRAGVPNPSAKSRNAV
jgi:hypothetical protein